MKNRRSLISLFLTISFTSLLMADDSVAERFEQFAQQESVGEERPTTSTSALPSVSSDLGVIAILRQAPREPVHRVSYSTSLYLSDNVAVSADNEEASSIFINALRYTYSKKVSKRSFLVGSASISTFDFSDRSDLSFTNKNLAAGLYIKLPDDFRLRAEARYDYASDDIFTDKIYHHFSSYLELSRAFQLPRDNKLNVALSHAYSVTSSDFFTRRNEVRLRLSHNYKVNSQLSVGTGATLSQREFNQVDRSDFTYSVYAQAQFRLRPNLNLNASVGYKENFSNLDNRDYDVFFGNSGISFNYKF